MIKDYIGVYRDSGCGSAIVVQYSSNSNNNSNGQQLVLDWLPALGMPLRWMYTAAPVAKP